MEEVETKIKISDTYEIPVKRNAKSQEREETDRIMGVTEFEGNRKLSD